ncbi:MAG: hypothetical protein QOH57_624 [Mycobacterium sp.]|jgi:hypothetical protein|nr:hypothetical protein [Mycobacterium sp.]
MRIASVVMASPDRDDNPHPTSSSPPRSVPASALKTVVKPFARTGRYYAKSRRDYLAGGASELPLVRPSFRLAAQALRDEVVLAGLQLSRPVSDGEDFERITHEVRDALDFYGQRGFLANPKAFYASPAPLTDLTLHQVNRRRHSYQRFVFDSGYAPYAGEPGRDRWLSYAASRREYGLLLRHPEPRPWLVCVHGTEMGRAGVDLRLFRAWHLHHDLGLNVILPVLPLHGPRKRGIPKGVALPGGDVMDDVHATAQAVWDIRRVLSWIRSQEPHSAIGLTGLSLGGYMAALVASLEDDLTCAILGVPVADLVDVLVRHSGLSDDDPRRDTIALAKPLGRMVSPLSLTPRVPMQGRFIYGGLADRVVHPRDQVIRLWEHWGKPEIVWYPGGHAGSFRSRPVNDFIDTALRRSGLVSA